MKSPWSSPSEMTPGGQLLGIGRESFSKMFKNDVTKQLGRGHRASEVRRPQAKWSSSRRRSSRDADVLRVDLFAR